MYPKRDMRRVLQSSCCFAAASVALLSPAGATTYTVAPGATQTVATPITGADNVLVTGGGTLVLTNTGNTYTGGTQVAGASLLQIDDDLVLGAGNVMLGDGATTGQLVFSGATTIAASRTITLGAGAETINTGTYTDTIAAGISGAGSLVKTGTGTLILTGANTYTGGTTVSGGTLQIGNGGTTGSITGSIANAGAVVFNRSDAITYSGNISGAGTLTVAGSGKVSLTATNSLTGGTTINAGSTLALSGAGMMTSSPLTIYGTYDISGITAASTTTKSLAGTGSIELGTKTMMMTSSPATPFYGVISGSGNLTINSGTTTLAGANTYTGTTTIASGATLQIGAQTTTGSIVSTNIVDNGTLTFSHSDTFTFGTVITGTGAVKQNGVGGVLILNAANTFTGTTTATVGTLVIGDAAHTNARVGGAATVSSTGILGGYGTIAGNLSNSGFVQAGYSSVGTLTVGGTYTQSSTGTLVAKISPDGASLLKVNGAATLGGSFSAVFDAGNYQQSLFPILTASSVTGKFAASSGVSGNVAYGIVYPASGTEVDLVVVPRTVTQVYTNVVTAAFDSAHALNDIALEKAAFESCGGSNCPRWTVWAQGVHGVNHVAAGNGAAGFNAHDSGVVGGFGYHFADGTSLNAAFGYTSSPLTVSDGSATASTDGVYLSALLHVPVKPVTIDLGGFYMSNTSDIARATGDGGLAASKLHSTVRGVTGEVAYPLYGGDVVPLVRWTSAMVSYGPFAETGGGVYGLNGSHGSAHVSKADLAVRLSRSYALAGIGSIRPHVELGADFNPWSTIKPVDASLSSTMNYVFDGIAPGVDKLSAIARVGVEAKVNERLSIGTELSGRYGNKQQQGSVSLSAAYRF